MSKIIATAIALTLYASAFASSQAICIGKNGNPCTDSEFNEKYCKPEKAPGNLFLAQPVRVFGTFLDPSGIPLDFEDVTPGYHTIVQIKSVGTGAILFAVPVNQKGQFDFERIPAGTYRLILVWMKDGKFRRLPLADQPKEIRCAQASDCDVHSVITFHGTDNLVDFCPPK
jgi:hypothetical protein